MVFEVTVGILHGDVIESQILHELPILLGQWQLQYPLILLIILPFMEIIPFNSLLNSRRRTDNLFGNFLTNFILLISVDRQARNKDL